eukprot:221546-Prorocentrum_lima.AAC.1
MMGKKQDQEPGVLHGQRVCKHWMAGLFRNTACSSHGTAWSYSSAEALINHLAYQNECPVEDLDWGMQYREVPHEEVFC